MKLSNNDKFIIIYIEYNMQILLLLTNYKSFNNILKYINNENNRDNHAKWWIKMEYCINN